MSGSGDGNGGALKFTVGNSSYLVTDTDLVYSTPTEVTKVPLDDVTYVRATKKEKPILPAAAAATGLLGLGVLTAPRFAAGFDAIVAAYGALNLGLGAGLITAGMAMASAYVWKTIDTGSVHLEVGGPDGTLFRAPVPGNSLTDSGADELLETIQLRVQGTADGDDVEENILGRLDELEHQMTEGRDDLAQRMAKGRDDLAQQLHLRMDRMDDIATDVNGLSTDLEELTSAQQRNAEDLERIEDKTEELEDATLHMLEMVAQYVERLTEKSRETPGNDLTDGPDHAHPESGQL